MIRLVAVTVFVALTLVGCGLDPDRVRRASLYGLDGVNQSLQAHPPLVLPPSPCYGCGRQ